MCVAGIAGVRDGRMKIGIVGAGGLGACLGAQLAEHGVDVTLVARGAHLAALEQRGLEVRRGADTQRVALPAVSGVARLGAVDALFVTVKTFSLESLFDDLRTAADQGTVVVPLLNGVDAADRLVEAGLPGASVVPGVAYLTGFLRGPGSVERVGDHGRIVLGQGETKRVRSRVEGLSNVFRVSGLQCRTSPKIEDELWRKMGVVCTLSAACVLFDGGMGRVRAHPYGPGLIREAAAEVVSVAGLRGAQIDADEILTLVDGFSDDFYPSVLHDLRSNRRTEVESLNGAIDRWARFEGRSAPVHAAASAVAGGH